MKTTRAIDFRFTLKRMEDLGWGGEKIYKWIKCNRAYYEITPSELEHYKTYYLS